MFRPLIVSDMCFLLTAAGANNRPLRVVRSEKGKITMWEKKMRQYLDGDKNPLNHDSSVSFKLQLAPKIEGFTLSRERIVVVLPRKDHYGSPFLDGPQCGKR